MIEGTQEQEEQKIKLEPKVDLERLGPCKLKVNFQIEAAKVKEVIDFKYSKLNETVQVPGFRRGHAPRGLLERKYGKDMLTEIKGELVENAYKEAIDAKKFEPLGDIELPDAEKLEVQPEGGFGFTCEVEVRPEIQIQNYTGMKVKRPKVQVTDDEVSKFIDFLRDQKAEWEPTEEPAAKGDQVIQDMELVCEGNVVSTDENVQIVLSERISFLNTPLPEYHLKFFGSRPGGKVEYTVKLKEDFSDPKLAGKEVLVRSTVKSVKRKKLPELNEEFAKSLDAESLDELRGEVRKKLLQQKEEDGRVDMFGQIMTDLMQQNDFPLPEGLVKKWAVETLRRHRLELIQRGATEEEVEAKMGEHGGAVLDQSVRTLKEHFIIEYIAGKEKIFVTEDEIDSRIAQLAQRQGRWPNEVREYLEQNDMLPALRRQMRMERVLEFLVSKASVE